MSATSQKVSYLRSLPAIRERSSKVHALTQAGKLQYFDYHPEKETDVVDFCTQIIRRDFGTDYKSIPPHGRWRHLDAGHPRVARLLDLWRSSNVGSDDRELCKRLIDLILVSVLLDAGAGNLWKYTEPGTDEAYSRSEGLAVASIHMFEAGFFSGDPNHPYRVDAVGLAKITPGRVAEAMQVSETNPMNGLEGRATLLSKLASALSSNPSYFGQDARPGNIIDYLESHSSRSNLGASVLNISVLWDALIDGMQAIWPATRTMLDGVSLGDVWPCSALPVAEKGDNLVPFHKLTGWTTYSLLEPLQRILHWEIVGIENMTGLPEYRNGGLLTDLGVLTLREGAIPSSFYPDPASTIPRLPPSHPAIIEWRAMTIVELDRIADGIRTKLNLSVKELSLAQVLESATWKGGREIAKQKRPQTGGPPIEIESDGTVF